MTHTHAWVMSNTHAWVMSHTYAWVTLRANWYDGSCHTHMHESCHNTCTSHATHTCMSHVTHTCMSHVTHTCMRTLMYEACLTYIHESLSEQTTDGGDRTWNSYDCQKFNKFAGSPRNFQISFYRSPPKFEQVLTEVDGKSLIIRETCTHSWVTLKASECDELCHSRESCPTHMSHTHSWVTLKKNRYKVAKMHRMPKHFRWSSLSIKEPLIIGLFCGKQSVKIRRLRNHIWRVIEVTYHLWVISHIITVYFPQKSPIINGFFGWKRPATSGIHAFSPPCMTSHWGAVSWICLCVSWMCLCVSSYTYERGCVKPLHESCHISWVVAHESVNAKHCDCITSHK